MEELQYPIGKFNAPAVITPDMRAAYIAILQSFPQKLEVALAGITEAQMDTPYRSGGWSLRQVVHHCADSHCNSFIRFKLTLTEDSPTVKPYFEERWAELADSKIMPIESSLMLLEGIHSRWTFLLKNMTDDDFAKEFIHPEHDKSFRLDTTLAMYAWHSEHHLAHIFIAMKKCGHENYG